MADSTARAPDVTSVPFTTGCRACRRPLIWYESPTGGWWAHVTHPDDGHDAVAPEPAEYINNGGEYITDEGVCHRLCDYPLAGYHASVRGSLLCVIRRTP